MGAAAAAAAAPPGRETHGGLDVLTAREQVVARLVAAGKTNREVAAELYVSVKTIEYHLSIIFTKLHIKSRRQLAAPAASR